MGVRVLPVDDGPEIGRFLESEAVRAARCAGADEFVRKPFDNAELVATGGDPSSSAQASAPPISGLGPVVRLHLGPPPGGARGLGAPPLERELHGAPVARCHGEPLPRQGDPGHRPVLLGSQPSDCPGGSGEGGGRTVEPLRHGGGEASAAGARGVGRDSEFAPGRLLLSAAEARQRGQPLPARRHATTCMSPCTVSAKAAG